MSHARAGEPTGAPGWTGGGGHRPGDDQGSQGVGVAETRANGVYSSSRGISRDVTIGLKTHIGHNIGLPGPERGGVETWFPGERCVENPYTGLAGWEPASPTLPTVAWPWQARRREPGSHQSNIHTHVLLLTLYSVARRQRAIG